MKSENSSFVDILFHLLDSEDVNIRISVFNNYNNYIKRKHIDKALSDPDWRVRCNAIQHPKATRKHIEKALNDDDVWVRDWASTYDNLSPKLIDKIIKWKDVSKFGYDSDSHFIENVVILNPNIETSNINKILRPEYINARNSAISKIIHRL